MQLDTDIHGNPALSRSDLQSEPIEALSAGKLSPHRRLSSHLNRGASYEKFYAPEAPGLLLNDRLPASGSPGQSFNQVVIKVDHNITPKDRLSGSWVYDHQSRTLVDSGGVWAPGSTDGGPMANARHQIVPSYQYRISEAHTFSPSLLNVVNATYNQYWNGSAPLSGTELAVATGLRQYGRSEFSANQFRIIRERLLRNCNRKRLARKLDCRELRLRRRCDLDQGPPHHQLRRQLSRHANQ